MLKSKKGKEIISNIPMERILIETDGPYGKINNRHIVPKDLPLIYKEFGLFLGVGNLKEIVFNNLKELLSTQLNDI
jgi:TatD DNase family protein